MDVILSRREDFRVFDTYISEYDRSMSLLQESCRGNPAFASIVKTFEVRFEVINETEQLAAMRAWLCFFTRACGLVASMV